MTHDGNAIREAAHGEAAYVFRQEGEYWFLVFRGAVVLLKDLKGLHVIAHLLRHPGRPFPVLELVIVVTGSAPSLTGCPTQLVEQGLTVGVPGDVGPRHDART